MVLEKGQWVAIKCSHAIVPWTLNISHSISQHVDVLIVWIKSDVYDLSFARRPFLPKPRGSFLSLVLTLSLWDECPHLPFSSSSQGQVPFRGRAITTYYTQRLAFFFCLYVLLFLFSFDLEQIQTRAACPLGWTSEDVNRRWHPVCDTCTFHI